ncbi:MULTISPECIES: lipoate--protein ligase family protein [Arthrobacter]|uniref:Lipoate--protein ligase family protein n=2 Tax=Arthrobacter TaxID=1663 RepID=A0ABU9KGW9_9MICC|nr:lipoate--protein ligase family protein [Arthrobacter sp. YJM1]MDP5226128.1 lipoate--protein ligase family protein [Arthrobacter sp. YJM1]
MSASEPVLPLTVVNQGRSLGRAEDLDLALQWLRLAQDGRIGPTLRLYRPEPTVAFGQRDAKLPGFAAAEQACRDLGFEPLIRKAGGRAAAYHPGCLVVDHIEPRVDAIAGAKARFSHYGDLLADALRSLGVLAAVGEIPGEYCPGEFSVHGNDPVFPSHQVKLIGTAQRVVSGAWLFSSVVVVEDSEPIRNVLTAAYEALGLEWSPATAGAVQDLVPHVTVEDVMGSVVARYSQEVPLAHASFDAMPGI